MDSYETWSKEDLITKIRSLEQGIEQNRESPLGKAHAQSSGVNSNSQPSETQTSSNEENNQVPWRPTPTALTQRQNRKRKQDRPFDFSKHPIRHVALKIAYVGWNYHGFASQESDTVETIESHLFRALRTAKLIPGPSELPCSLLKYQLNQHKICRWSRCGRTDKGVSAFDQVVGLYVRSALPAAESEPKLAWGDGWIEGEDAETIEGNETEGGVGESRERKQIERVDRMDVDQNNTTPSSDRKHAQPTQQSGSSADSAALKKELPYLTILNRLLPPDIRVLAWSPVPTNFNARFDCRYRQYKYFFPAESLNISLMQDAAKRFEGTHDFRNFAKVDMKKGENQGFMRTILNARIERMDGAHMDDERGAGHHADTFYVFIIKGTAFLWHQVRCMMAILFLVGQGLEPPSIVDDLLDISKHPQGSGRPVYDMASEIPLVLDECGYDESAFSWRTEDGADGTRLNATSATQPSSTGRTLNQIWNTWKDQATRSVLEQYLLEKVASQSPHYPPSTAEIKNGTSVSHRRDLMDFLFSEEGRQTILRGVSLSVGLGGLASASDASGGGKSNNGKSYVPIMNRPRCESWETRAEKSSIAKQQKAGKGQEGGMGGKKKRQNEEEELNVHDGGKDGSGVGDGESGGNGMMKKIRVD
ncbi:tRNA pseudouridine synthase 3 [Quaeritorhiza haematococci]|nr:tRNA pseudouridine synthase 3 [Quaeritorhiza haematococci]